MTDRVFIIAEAGVNHDGSLADALRMVDVAAEAGADAVKFQTFTAEALLTTRAMKADYQVANTGEGGAQMDMIRRLELSPADHDALYERCQERDIAFLSTAFDMDSLRFLARYDMPAIKIPSGDITWGPMLLEAARMGKPMLVSTGMATMDEIRDALAVIAFALTRSGDPVGLEEAHAALDSEAGQAALRRVVTLLHCTTQYPAPMEAVNLRAMTTMAQAFGLPAGYSDHTLGLTVPVAAVAMGARVVEKHFTLDRSRHGPDHAASLTPDELAAMVRAIRETEAALGSPEKAPSAAEVANRLVARRSLVAARGIGAGEVLEPDALTAKRPADGLSPMKAWDIAGSRAKQAYAPDDAIALETAA
jgi:N-acetylneuraminate synthase